MNIPVKPLVSIVLPTYNRAHFLPQAAKSISAQTYQNWELIIIDDGSTDDTEDTVRVLSEYMGKKLKYIKQQNEGPASARNKGIIHAQGDFIAFFDSDDLWVADHIAQAIEAFSEFTVLDWVYTACRRVNFHTGKILQESTFYTENKPNKLFSLKCEIHGDLYVVKDSNAVEMQIIDGIDSGLQNSIFRRSLFDRFAIPPFRIGEDRLFITMLLGGGVSVAFRDRVTVLYNVHGENMSDTADEDGNYEQRIQVLKALLDSYEKTPKYIQLSSNQRKVLKRRISKDYFWKLGYSLYWKGGYTDLAIKTYIRALMYDPSQVKMWKTLVLALLKYPVVRNGGIDLWK